MGKISAADKMRMQTLRDLREQGLGAKAIVKAYPEKQWKLDTVKRICLHPHLTTNQPVLVRATNKPALFRATHILAGKTT